MTEHDKILKMIEEVDPSDTDTLDEIDFLVGLCVDGKISDFDKELAKCNRELSKLRGLDVKYTRSLDVLHDAQLEGWISSNAVEAYALFTHTFMKSYTNKNGMLTTKTLYSQPLVTEALARCHAFVQTLKWRDGNE